MSLYGCLQMLYGLVSTHCSVRRSTVLNPLSGLESESPFMFKLTHPVSDDSADLAESPEVKTAKLYFSATDLIK
jgi:hypothetical protein